jgi:hypothetical protein
MNPSTLPTEPSPYGLETIVSGLRSGRAQTTPSFSIIKGYNRIGAGVSTAGNNTFYGNDIVQRHQGEPTVSRFKPSEKARGKTTNASFGTSVRLPFPRTPPLTLGGALRYKNITDTVGYGVGVASKLSYITPGFGISREKISNTLPTISFYTASLATQILFLEFEYNLLWNKGGYRLKPIHIGTVSTMIGPVLLTAAGRRLEYEGQGVISQFHYGAQILWKSWLATGVLFNYIPGANSVAVQIFF